MAEESMREQGFRNVGAFSRISNLMVFVDMGLAEKFLLGHFSWGSRMA